MRRSAWVMIAGLLAFGVGLGCSDSRTTEAFVGCLVDEEIPVTDPNAVPEGFTLSAAEAAVIALGTWEGELDRVDLATRALTLTLERRGPTVVQRRSWRAEGGATTLAEPVDPGCGDAYAIPATLRFSALPDLNEDDAVQLEVGVDGLTRFSARLDGETLAGSAVPLTEPREGVSALELFIHGARPSAEDAWDGEVAFGVERQHGSAVSFTLDPYGLFTAGPEPAPSEVP